MSAATNRSLRAGAAAALAGGLLSVSIPVLARPSPAAPGYARIVEEGETSVVPVRFQLRPKERPKGGEGQKLRRLTCGVFAGVPGQVVISADYFPDIDEGPEALEPFDFRLVLASGEEVPAQPAGIDRDLNIAFLQADPRETSSFRAAAFDKDVEAAVGDEVVLVGLLPEKYNFARVTYAARVNAVISQPRRMYSLDQPVEDLAIGGLVLLKDGRPLGIVGEDLVLDERVQGNASNILSLLGSVNQGPRPGYPMVFPFSTFSTALTSPPKEERLENRGWLGITMQPLSRDLGEYWNIDSRGGVIVAGVVEGSPAAAAGLEAGDVILEVDGHDVAVREQADLVMMQRTIRTAGAGRDIPMAVWRNGDMKQLNVRLAASPTTASTAKEYEDEAFGMKVRELTYDYLQAANLDRSTRGVVVIGLERAGWAQVSGLETRDIIQKVAGEPTPDLESLKTILGKLKTSRPREIMFFVLRDYQTQFVRVKADWKQVKP